MSEPCDECDEAPVLKTEDGKVIIRCDSCGAQTATHDSDAEATAEWIARTPPKKPRWPCTWGLHWPIWHDFTHEKCAWCETVLPRF